MSKSETKTDGEKERKRVGEERERERKVRRKHGVLFSILKARLSKFGHVQMIKAAQYGSIAFSDCIANAECHW